MSPRETDNVGYLRAPFSYEPAPRAPAGGTAGPSPSPAQVSDQLFWITSTARQQRRRYAVAVAMRLRPRPPRPRGGAGAAKQHVQSGTRLLRRGQDLSRVRILL